MKIIVISRPDFFEGETLIVEKLFECGLERLHLRKPHCEEKALEDWIKDISEAYRRRIVLHDHFGLASQYSLGGVHLNSRNPLPPSRVPGMTISRSCHSIEELKAYKGQCDYLFLSPIYDSISKEGYGSAFSRQTLDMAASEGIIDYKTYALGGVSIEHIEELKSIGFGGAAVLGALWQSDRPEEYLKRLLEE
ncbi:MAG TPA: thiamine phosphate synthase [Rikenellaceae bacterium]|nr:thiamine phosphate synthase [Rikenellaceae bacterium]HBH21544.1 thiamine phosphate synthase [Rikenellaceae bacterium]